MSNLGGFSWANPFPMMLDDAETEIELAYDGLHEAAGVNAGDPSQSALAQRPPDPTLLSWFDVKSGQWEGLADLEVKVQAIALGASMTWVEHAMWEGFPHTMTDSLGAWEKILGIFPVAISIEERQRAVVLAWTRIADASNPALGDMLYRISPKLALDTLDQNLWTSTLFGKFFEPYTGITTYRSGLGRTLYGTSSKWPAYSDAFRVRVRYNLGAGETQPPTRLLAMANTALLEVLPAWATWEVYTLSDDGSSGLGFYLDGGPNNDSFLDVTAFGDV